MRKGYANSARRLGSALLAALLAFASARAAAEPPGPRVAVRPKGPRTGRGMPAALRDSLEDALRHSKGLRRTSAARAHHVLHGRIRALERSRHTDGQAQVRCEVSVIVAERRSGAIRIMLRGAATARGGRRTALARRALDAAVRSALGPLPRALSRRSLAMR